MLPEFEVSAVVAPEPAAILAVLCFNAYDGVAAAASSEVCPEMWTLADVLQLQALGLDLALLSGSRGLFFRTGWEIVQVLSCVSQVRQGAEESGDAQLCSLS